MQVRQRTTRWLVVSTSWTWKSHFKSISPSQKLSFILTTSRLQMVTTLPFTRFVYFLSFFLYLFLYLSPSISNTHFTLRLLLSLILLKCTDSGGCNKLATAAKGGEQETDLAGLLAKHQRTVWTVRGHICCCRMGTDKDETYSSRYFTLKSKSLFFISFR